MWQQLLPFAGKLIDKLIPDPEAKAKAQLELAQMAQQGELQKMANETELYKLEQEQRHRTLGSRCEYRLMVGSEHTAPDPCVYLDGLFGVGIAGWVWN
jgi:hypothetical protein